MSDKSKETGAQLLARMNEECGNEQAQQAWDRAFEHIDLRETQDHNNTWDGLFRDVRSGWRSYLTPLGLCFRLLERYPKNPTILYVIVRLPGYRIRHQRFYSIIKAREEAAAKFAISPETKQLREDYNYGRQSRLQ